MVPFKISVQLDDAEIKMVAKTTLQTVDKLETSILPTVFFKRIKVISRYVVFSFRRTLSMGLPQSSTRHAPVGIGHRAYHIISCGS